MKIIILSLLTLFAFTGCFTSSLSLSKEKELVLKYDANEMLLSSEVLSSELLNFKDLFVSRYKLKSADGGTLFYELAKTSLAFEFSYSGLYTVMYIFDNSKEYEEVLCKNNLTLVQVKLKDARYLNVLIQASDTQVYSYVYGFSNDEFLSMANSIFKKNELKIEKLKFEGITFAKEQIPITNWSDEVVFFTPLIMPFRAYGLR